MLKSKILSEKRRQLLKKLLRKKTLIRVIEAHSGISGMIGENARIKRNGQKKEFDCLWISSLTDSVAKGYPDEEIVSIDSRLNTVNQVLNVTSKPIIYDGDTGGFPEQLNYLVKQLERLGVSAVVLEDKKYPKSNSLLHSARHNMETIEGFVEKIKYAKNTQRSREFMVIGRIESLIVGEPPKKAIERAKAYLKAGADGIMIHSKSKDPSQVMDFAKEYNRLFRRGRKPLMCVPTTYCSVKEAELQKAGFNIVLYANHLLRASYNAMENVCKCILDNDRAQETANFCATIEDILKPVGSLRTYLAEYKDESSK